MQRSTLYVFSYLEGTEQLRIFYVKCPESIWFVSALHFVIR